MINTKIGNPRVILERCNVDKQSSVVQNRKENTVSRVNCSWKYSFTASKVKMKKETLFKSRVSISLNSHITSSPANEVLKSTFFCSENARKRSSTAGTNAPDFSSMKACYVSLTDVLRTKSAIKKKRKLNVSASQTDQSKLLHILSIDASRTETGKKQCKSTACKNQINSAEKELKILLKRCDDVKSSNESSQPTSIVNRVNNLGDSNKLSIELESKIKEQYKVESTYFTGRSPKIILKRCDDKMETSFGTNKAQRKPLAERNHSCMALAGVNGFNITNDGLSFKTQPGFIIKTHKKIKMSHEVSYTCSSMNFMKTSPRVILEKCDSKGWNLNIRASENLYETFNDETLSQAHCFFYPEVIVETASEIDFEWEIRKKYKVDSVFKGPSLQTNEDHIEEALHQNLGLEDPWASSSLSINFDPQEANVSGLRSNEKDCFPSNLNTDSGGKPFLCRICPARFKRKSSILKHQITVHSETKPSPGDVTKEFESLSDQFSQRIKEIPLSCKHCSANFKHKAHLRDHLMTHSAGRPFPCELCPARFSSPYYLKYHLVIHSSEKPYSCEYCPAKFKRVSTLKSHQITHTEASFSCHFCSTRFRKQDALHRHLTKKCKQIQETQLFTTEQLLLLQNVLFDGEKFPRI